MGLTLFWEINPHQLLTIQIKKWLTAVMYIVQNIYLYAKTFEKYVMWGYYCNDEWPENVTGGRTTPKTGGAKGEKASPAEEAVCMHLG